MLRTLLRNGIGPDRVYGTSIGALNGGALALDPTARGRRATGGDVARDRPSTTSSRWTLGQVGAGGRALLPLAAARAAAGDRGAELRLPDPSAARPAGPGRGDQLPGAERTPPVADRGHDPRGARIEDTAVPFTAMAAEVSTGRLVVP